MMFAPEQKFRREVDGEDAVATQGRRAREKQRMQKLSTASSRTHTRGLDVDGNVNIKGSPTRPRTRGREGLLCSWREACKAADYVLEHFGNPLRDRGIWVWYCQRIGLDAFLDLADEIVSSWKQQEIRWPVRAFQRHLMDALPKEAAR